jgi:hypothetical protein
MRFCNDVKKSEFVVHNAVTGKDEPQTCPKATASGHGSGARCDGGVVTEQPGFWRDPARGSRVNSRTVYYRCPQVGACRRGANCSEGHHGVLCAVCARGYALRLGECKKCPGAAAAGEAAGILLGAVAAIVVGVMAAKKAHKLKKALVSEQSKLLVKSLLKVKVQQLTS